MKETPKYKTLKDLKIAIQEGKEPSAFCTYDKEFVRITSEKGEDPMGAGENLYDIDDYDFVEDALRAIGVEMY